MAGGGRGSLPLLRLKGDVESEHSTGAAVLLITCWLQPALMNLSLFPYPAKVPLPFLPPFPLEGDRRGCFLLCFLFAYELNCLPSG